MIAFRSSRKAIRRIAACVRMTVLAVPITLASAARADEPQTSPSPSPAPPETIVVGQVFDHVGAGVEDTLVTVTLKDTGEKIGEARTDAYGDFQITADERAVGPAVVRFTKRYYQTVDNNVVLEAEGDAPFVDTRLEGAIKLPGTVSDSRDGSPVDGAEVKARSGYKTWSATSDADGQFALEGLVPGRVMVTIEADGFARRQIGVEQTEAGEPLVVKLSPERIVHLLITDESGKAIGGVGVETLDKPRNDYRQSLSDDEGKLTVRGLAFEADKLKVRLHHDAYVSSVDFDRTIDLPADEAESSHTLVMKQAGALVGRIIDAETRDPLIGARVSVGEVLSDYCPREWSGPDGKYRVTGVPPGPAVVTVHLSGRAPQLRNAEIKAGAETRLNFSMAEPRTIVGDVVDSEGEPLEEVYVRATDWQGHDTLGLRAMTDAKGRFEIIDAPREAFEVSVYRAEFKPMVNQMIAADQNDYHFVMTPDPRAQGPNRKSFRGGEDAPLFEVRTLDGETIKSRDLKGKVVLIDFWATWCGPCVAEIPNLMAVHKKFGERDDFVMISVSLDDNVPALSSFVKAHKMDWRQVCGTAGNVEPTAEAFAVVGIPSIHVIGRDGKFVASDVRGPEIARAVAAALGDSPGGS